MIKVEKNFDKEKHDTSYLGKNFKDNFQVIWARNWFARELRSKMDYEIKKNIMKFERKKEEKKNSNNGGCFVLVKDKTKSDTNRTKRENWRCATITIKNKIIRERRTWI